MTDQEFVFKVEELKAGYALWRNIVERYNLSARDYVIAFPHRSDEINECGVMHLERFRHQGGAEKRVLILCVGDEVPNLLASKTEDDTIRIEILQEDEMESLITLYAADTISSHFIMMSLNRPYGRYGDRALKRGVTLDEIIDVGIYRIPHI